jgi:hypothetical protein
MILDCVLLVAGLLVTGIEAAYVPSDDGGGDYLVRVEPDLVRNANPYQFTSDVPADARDVRRVKIYVADTWPPAVERSVIEAAKRPRRPAPVAAVAAPVVATQATTHAAKVERPWSWLIGSLIALFLSLGANAYLGVLLASMRQRYLEGVQRGYVRA